ncbi:C1 family peptidase [Psychromicrobium lacuslunae]|uniref:C1 family peptidase n=1 Tax=Psychromicrobium lacuslunae TaxID=1618207 RepID=UPI0009E3FE2C|nr:C1 family peptidase [Psychromicrobium lacuslunae]
MNKNRFFSALAVVTAALTLASGAGLAQAAPTTALVQRGAHSVEVYGHGFNFKAAAADQAKLAKKPAAELKFAAAPTSYSLKQYAVTPGNQGRIGSCVTWATGYAGYGILMNEANAQGGPMAPIFIYSQIVDEYNDGEDSGTWASIALPMEKERGIDTKAHYNSDVNDYQTLPTASQKANALNYKLGSFTNLTNADRKAGIKAAISQGHPVPIGFRGRSNFEGLDSSNSYYDPSQGTLLDWGHEVTVVGYDANGVTVQNSWGTGWGNGGFFTAPWSWITSSDVNEVHSMDSLAFS